MKRVIYPIVTICLVFLVQGLHCQQLDLSTLYRYNWQILNPAAINHLYLEDNSNRKQYVFNATFRRQWIGFEGAPTTYNARFEYMPKANSNEVSPIKVGFFASGDQAGAINTNKFFGNFAYLIYFNRSTLAESYLSVGLNVGLVRYNVDINEIRFQEQQNNIPVDGVLNQAYADMALGCFFRKKTYDPYYLPTFGIAEVYAGISVPQTFTMDLSQTDDGAFDLKRVQHFYLITGGVLTINSKLLLEPSLWVRYLPNGSFQTLFDNTPVSGDLNMRLQYKNKVWAGVGASTNRLLHFEAGFTLGQGEQSQDCKNYLMNLGFAYDAPVGWNSWLGPSAEISLGIGWE